MGSPTDAAHLIYVFHFSLQTENVCAHTRCGWIQNHNLTIYFSPSSVCSHQITACWMCSQIVSRNEFKNNSLKFKSWNRAKTSPVSSFERSFHTNPGVTLAQSVESFNRLFVAENPGTSFSNEINLHLVHDSALVEHAQCAYTSHFSEWMLWFANARKSKIQLFEE